MVCSAHYNDASAVCICKLTSAEKIFTDVWCRGAVQLIKKLPDITGTEVKDEREKQRFENTNLGLIQLNHERQRLRTP